MKKVSSVISVIVFCSAMLFAQASGNDKFFSEYVTRAMTTSDGLPGNTINDIVQGQNAYLYFGSYDGLVRFDGNEFLVINRNSNPDYGFVSVRSLFEDSQGRLWVGANDEGLTCIWPDGKIENFTIDNGLPNNSIRAITEDRSGIIWIGTATGIACIKDSAVVQVPGWETVPEDNKMIIRQLFCDSAGRIWIVAGGRTGLYLYSDGNFTRYTKIHSFDDADITYVTQDSSRAYWFGVGYHNVIRMDEDYETVYDLSEGLGANSSVNCIYQDSKGNMWIGTEKGIAVLHNGQKFYLKKSSRLNEENITRITEDRDSNIWITTDGGGIEKFSQTKFKTTTMASVVNAIAQDRRRDVVWIGCDDGLYCYRGEEFVTSKITDYCKGERIRHVAVANNGDLLISTYKEMGQIRYGIDGSIRNWTVNDGLPSNKTRVALESQSGDLYIGTTSGLAIIDGETGAIETVTTKNGISNEYIMCLFEDDDHNIWVGTDGGGIFLLKDKKLTAVYTTDDGLAGNVVFKIFSLSKNEIWVCTGNGVSRWYKNKFFTFNYSNGLGIDSVFQMIPDFTQRVWCTSNRGIFSVSLAELEDVAAGRKKTVNSKYFGYSDGIISRGVTATSLSMKDDIGRVWFTLSDGFTVYNPVKNSENKKPPVVHVQNVVVDNNVFDGMQEKITMKPGDKRVSVRFTGISFVSSEQVQFSYKLDGFDNDFCDWTKERTASYTNLKPGTYVFKLKARNSDEIQSEPLEITIVKKPALYQIPLFWVVLVLAVCAAIVFYVQHNFNKLKEESDRRQKTSLEVAKALVGTIDAKDKYTKGHSLRVAEYSVKLAERLGKDKEYCDNLYITALLHDIGKIGIPDSIINKPGKLSVEEYDVIKSHPVIGSKILSSITSIPDMHVGAHWHHERWDGKGYPDGLKAEEIPEIARIIGVADAYDAMTSNRSYRNYMIQSKARSEIEQFAGSQFDPVIAKKMLDLIDEDVNYKMHE